MFTRPFSGQLSSADTMNGEQITTFHNGYQTLILSADSVLWRFVSKQADHRFGAFWLDSETMQTIMQSLHTMGNFSLDFKKDTVRNNLAILEKWSNVSWRLKIKLRKEVVAHVGFTETQYHFIDVPNTFSFGGGEKIEKLSEKKLGVQKQYVIPRFSGLPDSNEWASIEHFAHV